MSLNRVARDLFVILGLILMPPAGKAVLDALRLMRRYDRRIGMEIGQTTLRTFNDELFRIIRSIDADERVPYAVKQEIIKSVRKASNEFQDQLWARDVPLIQGFLLALRALRLPIDKENSKLAESKRTLDAASQEDRRIEAERERNPNFRIGPNELLIANERNQLLKRQVDGLWTDIVKYNFVVLGLMAEFATPEAQELTEAFTGEP
jgi:hypothetical protein